MLSALYFTVCSSKGKTWAFECSFYCYKHNLSTGTVYTL